MRGLSAIVLSALFTVTALTRADTPPAEPQKAVLVTGASTGIGRKITERLAAAGYFVYATARKPADLEDAGKNPECAGRAAGCNQPTGRRRCSRHRDEGGPRSAWFGEQRGYRDGRPADGLEAGRVRARDERQRAGPGPHDARVRVADHRGQGSRREHQLGVRNSRRQEHQRLCDEQARGRSVH